MYVWVHLTSNEKLFFEHMNKNEMKKKKNYTSQQQTTFIHFMNEKKNEIKLCCLIS